MTSVLAKRVRIGMLTPASNTNIEPITYAMLHDLPHVTAHFSRFPLPKSLNDEIQADLLGPAAALLAQAQLAALVFNGTAGSWKGLEGDRSLCDTLFERTGLPTTTASLATVAALQHIDAKAIGLVFTGPRAIAEEIVAEYATVGLNITAITGPSTPLTNPETTRLTSSEVEQIVAPAFSEEVDVVACVGTNLAAAPWVATFEARYGISMIDSASAALWQSLEMMGVAERPAGWGTLVASSSQPQS